MWEGMMGLMKGKYKVVMGEGRGEEMKSVMGECRWVVWGWGRVEEV